MIIRISLAMALVFVAAVLTAAASRPQENDVQTGFLFRSLEVDGREYQYVLYVPRAYATSRDGPEVLGDRDGWPFILFLHGMGESGTDGQRQMLIGPTPRIIDKEADWPFIVLMPQKPVATDQWEDHAEAVERMLDRTLAEYHINEGRLYLTGLSQGGHGTWVYPTIMKRRFAAIAPVCGYAEAPVEGYVAERTWKTDADSPLTKRVIAAAAQVPVWAFHGEADPVVPASQTTFLVEQIRAAGGDVKLTLYPGVGHDSWTKAYAEDLPAWFLSHRRKDDHRSGG